VIEQEDTRKETQLLFLSYGYYTINCSRKPTSPYLDIYDSVADHCRDYQNCPCAHGSEFSSPSFVGDDYYCESGIILVHNLRIAMLLISSMTHCGTDLVASLDTVVTTLPKHGFTKS